MGTGHVLAPRIIGQPDDAAVDNFRPSCVQDTDGGVSDYSEFVEHITQVLRDALIDRPDTGLERPTRTRRTEVAR
jgi:hypothetical protein